MTSRLGTHATTTIENESSTFPFWPGEIDTAMQYSMAPYGAIPKRSVRSQPVGVGASILDDASPYCATQKVLVFGVTGGLSCLARKLLYRRYTQPLCQQPRRIEELETSMSQWPALSEDDEVDATASRGVFAPMYRRNTLFSQTVDAKTSELPRWKPHVNISRRVLESND
jgi:hypothetical protein